MGKNNQKKIHIHKCTSAITQRKQKQGNTRDKSRHTGIQTDRKRQKQGKGKGEGRGGTEQHKLAERLVTLLFVSQSAYDV